MSQPLPIKKPAITQYIKKKMDVKEAEIEWMKLNKAIDEIYLRNSSKLSFEQLFRCCHDLVLAKQV